MANPKSAKKNGVDYSVRTCIPLVQFIYAVNLSVHMHTSYFHVHALAQEDVCTLQVPVSNVQGVAVGHAFTDLLQKETCFAFWKATLCARVVQQGSVFCQFQCKEAVQGSLHYLQHRHDAGMRHSEQDIYLVWQKVGQVAVRHLLLVDHFQGNLK